MTVQNTLTKTWTILKDATAHFGASDGWAMASHIALSMIMALFPFLIFTTSLAGFLGYEAQSGAIVDLVFDTWPDDIANPIVREVNTVLADRHAGFMSAAILLAMFFASNGVEAVRAGLGRAYSAPSTKSFVKARLQSLVFVVCGAVLLLAMSFFMTFRPQLFEMAVRSLPFLAKLEVPLVLLRFAMAIGVLLFAVFACHAWLPAGKRTISEIWPGILVTLVLWVVCANIFTAYLHSFSDYGATFAGLAGIMVALVFLYLMAVILLIGGELNAALAHAENPARWEDDGSGN